MMRDHFNADLPIRFIMFPELGICHPTSRTIGKSWDVALLIHVDIHEAPCFSYIPVLSQYLGLWPPVKVSNQFFCTCLCQAPIEDVVLELQYHISAHGCPSPRHSLRKCDRFNRSETNMKKTCSKTKSHVFLRIPCVYKGLCIIRDVIYCIVLCIYIYYEEYVSCNM